MSCSMWARSRSTSKSAMSYRRSSSRRASSESCSSASFGSYRIACASSPAGTKPRPERLEETLMHVQQPPDRFLEGVDAGLEPFEQQNPDQTAQVEPGPMQAGIGLPPLLRRPERSATGRSARRSVRPLTRSDGLPFRALPDIAAQLSGRAPDTCPRCCSRSCPVRRLGKNWCRPPTNT